MAKQPRNPNGYSAHFTRKGKVYKAVDYGWKAWPFKPDPSKRKPLPLPEADPVAPEEPKEEQGPAEPQNPDAQ